MRRNHAGPAVAAVVAALSAAAVVAGAPTAVTAVLALPLLAAPGYVWTEVLFGGRLAGMPRVLAVTCLSLMVPVLGGLVLYAAGLPLHRTAWVCLLAGVTVLGGAVILARQRSTPPAPAGPARGRPRLRRLLNWHTAAFAAAAVIAAGGVGLAAAGAAIQPYPGFTQLWLVPAHGTAGRDALGVSNHEGTTERYRLLVLRHGRRTAAWTISLGDGRTWRTLIHATGREAITADLYRLPDLKRPFRQVTSAVPAKP